MCQAIKEQIVQSVTNVESKLENQPDIIPELRHCRDEFDAAARVGDIEAIKAIFKREGLPWVERQLPEKYKSVEDLRSLT